MYISGRACVARPMSGGAYKRKQDQNDDERTNIQKYINSAEAFTGLISKMQAEISKCPILIGLCKQHGIEYTDKTHIMRNMAKIEEFLSECQSIYKKLHKRIEQMHAPACSAAVEDASVFTHNVCEAIPEIIEEFTGPFQVEMSIASDNTRDPYGNAFLPSTPYELNEINSLSTGIRTIQYRVPNRTCVLHVWARTNKPIPEQYKLDDFYDTRIGVSTIDDHNKRVDVNLRENTWRIIRTLTYSDDDIINLSFSDEYGRVLRRIQIVYGCDEDVIGIGRNWNPIGARNHWWKKCPVYGNLSV